jgi:Zn-finger nucleic acid-binding protein
MDSRLLIACKSCRRQYDVSGMRPGEHVRCRCGELEIVPETRPHEARILHCSGCGGKLREKAARCDYCGGEVTADDRNLGPACPACFARLRGGARYCSECGIEIRLQALRTVRASARCPRCAGELVLREAEGEAHYTECTRCGGIWLDPTSFERVIDVRDAAARPSFVRAKAAGTGPAPAAASVSYVPCPVCGTMMNRKNFGGSGIIIDWCKGHGLWFDVHELEKIVAFAAAGGLDRQRKLELEKMKARAAAPVFAARNPRGAAVHSRPGRATPGDWVTTLGDIFMAVGDLFT